MEGEERKRRKRRRRGFGGGRGEGSESVREVGTLFFSYLFFSAGIFPDFKSGMCVFLGFPLVPLVLLHATDAIIALILNDSPQ